MIVERNFILLLVLFAPRLTVSRLEGESRGLNLINACGQDSPETCECDDLNEYTLDTCNKAGHCVYTCIDDGNACTFQSLENNNCVPQQIDCDAGQEYMSSTCDPVQGCISTCIEDGNLCTTQSLEVNNCVPQEINAADVCDDRNDETIDSCVPETGCSHICDDGNACTNDTWDDVKGECVFEIKICDDENVSTLDICLPSEGGCKFLDFSSIDLDSFEAYYENNIANLPENAYFYEDETSLTDANVVSLLNWINKKVVLAKTPYCYKQSYGRGVGQVLTTCPSPKEKIGALCYTPCRPGYSRQGTFDCQQECKAGWRDDGLFCRRAEYGRGAGYPWQFGDPLNDSGMFRRCEADHGRGNCEKWGAVVYPKCQPGYSPFGCCICRPAVPNCAAEGYNAPGIDLSCPVKIELGDPTPLICASGLEQDGALCYPPCREGFNGIGPVCWQICDEGGLDCGVGCAADSATCALSTIDMILGPLILAANVATLGLTAAPANAARTVVIGSKAIAYSNNVGYAMLNLAKLLRTVNMPDIPEGATLIRRAWLHGGPYTVVNVRSVVHAALTLYSFLYAEKFEELTTTAINVKLDQELEPEDALYIKSLWATLQFAEIQAAEGWNIAQNTLAVASLVDITGLTGAVAAYANPICVDVVPFPDI